MKVNFKIILILFIFAFTNCQKDDFYTQQNSSTIERHLSVYKTVSASDIPDVMSFIKSKSNEELSFEINSSGSSNVTMRNHEENLILTNLLQEQIKQATNQFGKSSYTFKLIEQEDKQGIYFLNLIVKEYKETFYMYIVSYVPDIAWLKSLDGQLTLSDFTGKLYFYNETGQYLAQATMSQGKSISTQRTPCPGDTDGNDNSDPWNDGDYGDDGAGGNGAGGGIDCTVIVSFGESSGTPCSSNCEGELVGDHDHDATDGDSWVNVEVICGGSQRTTSHDLFRTDPCPGGSGSGGVNTPDCSDSENNCTFPMTYDANCECVEAEALGNGDNGVYDDYLILGKLRAALGIEEFTDNQINWILANEENTTAAWDIFNFVLEESFSEESVAAAQITLELAVSENLTNFYTPEYEAILAQHLPPNSGLIGILLKHQEHTIREMYSIISTEYEHGHVFTYWELIKIALRAQNQSIHFGLQAAGMAPGVGIVFDIVDGTIYAVEMDWGNATLSLGAALPVAGQWVTTARWSKRVIALANGKKVYLKVYNLANGVVRFSNRGQLRKVLQITDSAIHAHHIIPYSFGEEITTAVGQLIQAAAKSNNVWHINDIFNGIPMLRSLHQAGHAAYSTAVRNKLTQLFNDVLSSPNNYDEAYDILSDFVAALKNRMEAFPDSSVGDFVDFINNYTP